MLKSISKGDYILRRKQVKSRTGLSDSGLYRRIANQTFPSPIPLGLGSRAVGWLGSEVDDWIAEQVSRSRGLTSDTGVQASGDRS